MPLYRVVIEGLSITKVEKMFESVPTIPMLNTYLSELQVKLAGYEYSRDEQVIGKWIDGRNLYRKVIMVAISSQTRRKPLCLMAWKISIV